MRKTELEGAEGGHQALSSGAEGEVLVRAEEHGRTARGTPCPSQLMNTAGQALEDLG